MTSPGPDKRISRPGRFSMSAGWSMMAASNQARAFVGRRFRLRVKILPGVWLNVSSPMAPSTPSALGPVLIGISVLVALGVGAVVFPGW